MGSLLAVSGPDISDRSKGKLRKPVLWQQLVPALLVLLSAQPKPWQPGPQAPSSQRGISFSRISGTHKGGPPISLCWAQLVTTDGLGSGRIFLCQFLELGHSGQAFFFFFLK